MALSVIVCVKPVPSSEKATIDPQTKMVKRDAGESVINTLDKNALAAAAELKKSMDCDVTILSMAPPAAEINLREALARGGDRVIQLSDRAFAGGDTFATSYVIAEAVRKIGKYDLILTGEYSSDGGTSQLHAQLAERLGIDHIHNVRKFEINGDTLTAESETGSTVLSWEGKLPMLISVGRKINTPGAVAVRDIVMARRKEYTVWSLGDLENADAEMMGLGGSPTQFGEIHPIDNSRNCIVHSRDSKEIAAELLDVLDKAGVLI